MLLLIKINSQKCSITDFLLIKICVTIPLFVIIRYNILHSLNLYEIIHM